MIKFARDVITDHVRNKGEKRCRYKIFQWRIKGSFDIFNDISDHIMLIQLRDTSGNFNHVVSITGCRIFFPIIKETLL